MIQHCAGDNIRSRSDSAKLVFFYSCRINLALHIPPLSLSTSSQQLNKLKCGQNQTVTPGFPPVILSWRSTHI